MLNLLEKTWIYIYTCIYIFYHDIIIIIISTDLAKPRLVEITDDDAQSHGISSHVKSLLLSKPDNGCHLSALVMADGIRTLSMELHTRNWVVQD